jgi:predicted AAA+ superfamily ATPase
MGKKFVRNGEKIRQKWGKNSSEMGKKFVRNGEKVYNLIMQKEVNRLIEGLIKYKLNRHGAVLINGPKYAGKSYTCNKLSESKILLESDLDFIQRIRENTNIALDGQKPRFIDEWQYCPFL